MFFKNLWEKIQYIGYTKQLSDYEKKRIVIFNTLNFTAFCLAIIRLSYTLLFTPSHFTYWAVVSDVALTMVFVSMALLLHHHLYKLATITSFIFMPPLLAFSSIVSKDVGTEMYIVLYMLFCFFFLHKPKKIFIAFTYCLVFFLVLRIKFQSPINISRAEPVSLYFGVLNYLCAFASILFTLYLIKFQVWKYEKSIRDKKELLRVSNIKIQANSNQIKEQSVLLQIKNIELTELNNVKIKLFSIISHDLRTSVYALKNILDTLAKGHFTKDEMLMALPGVTGEVDNCIELMDNLLSWGRNQLNERRISLQRIAVHKIIESTYKLFSKKAAEKGIHLVNKVAPETNIYADEDMIKTVVRNLVSNALKFTHSGGRIEIFTEKNVEFIKLTVKDNGVGISENALQQIYSNEYYTTLGTGREMGTGLGLMICRDFIKSNNGDFDVLSKKDEGASFIITLPGE